MPSLMDELGAGPLLYGCMRIGGEWNREPPTDADRAVAFTALDAARECGIRMFDHADIYALGRSETLFGEWRRSRGVARRELIVQTKVGIRPGEDGAPDRYDFSSRYLLDAVEGCLSRLGIEDIDILLLHRPDPLGEPEEVARAVDEMKRRGWIRAFGVSNFSAAQVRLYQRAMDEPIRVNQLELSLRHAGLVESGVQVNRAQHSLDAGAFDLLDSCREMGIDVQAWSPLSQGRPGGDVLDETLREMSVRASVAPEAIELAWLLRHPARVRPIIGTTRPERIRALSQATAVSLSREDWYSLFNAARQGELP